MKTFKAISSILFLLGLFYGFLCFCNWSFHPMEWNGFSRFIGAIAILWAIVEIDDKR